MEAVLTTLTFWFIAGLIVFILIIISIIGTWFEAREMRKELEQVNAYLATLNDNLIIGFQNNDRQSRNFARIPEDTDILITHSPAYGILDFDDGINYGSEEILHRLPSIPNLKAHLFGHIHAQHGIMSQNGITFSNGAIMNYDYSDLSKPRIIEL